MESRFCSKCGAPLNPGAKFCAKCGAAVVNRAETQDTETMGQPVQMPQQVPDTVTPESSVQPQMDVEPATENRKSKKKKWVILSIILAAVLVMVVIPGTIALIIRSQIKKHSGPVPPTAFAQTVDAEDDAGEAEEEDEDETAAVDAFFPAGDYSGEVDEDGEDSDGLKLPVAGPGEKVYIGYGDLDGVGLTKMALILSEDRQSVHDIVILLDGINSQLGGYNVMFSNMQTSTTAEYDLPATDETLGQSTIKDMHLEGDYIYMRLDYVFTNISFGTSTQDQMIPLGETEIWLREAG